MIKIKIYLSGGMTDLTYEEANGWRKDIQDYFKYDKKVEIFNPVQKNYLTDDIEGMRYDLDKLNQANLVIVNFNNPNSIGTAVELGYAYRKRIPIIGLNDTDKKLHSWLSAVCVHVFDNFDDMLDFVDTYYIEY